MTVQDVEDASILYTVQYCYKLTDECGSELVLESRPSQDQSRSAQCFRDSRWSRRKLSQFDRLNM